ncbi:MAG: aminotransferase class V-fold PLP-dependent enzyme [Planctomycetota bacterium]
MKNDWLKIRKSLLYHHSTINLNFGSFGIIPRPVWEHVTELRAELSSQPMNFYLRKVSGLLKKARYSLAKHIDTCFKNIVFCQNVTFALNMVANSINLQPGDIVLITNLEYEPMKTMWQRVCQRQGAQIQIIDLSDQSSNNAEIIASFKNRIVKQTKVLFVSHICSPTGMVLPVREICQLAATKNIITVIDGAHAPGCLNFSINDISADYYAGNLHKWLGCPLGSAFLACTENALTKLDPQVVSWGYKSVPELSDDAEDEFGTTPNIRRLEFTGTIDPCPWLTLPTAISFRQSIGLASALSRQTALANFARELLSDFKWLNMVTPTNHDNSCSMIAYQVGLPITLNGLRKFLWEKHMIEIGLNQHPNLGLLMRISCHYSTLESEIQHLASALRDLEKNYGTLPYE